MELTIRAGENRCITETSRFDILTISDGAVLTTLAGKQLSLTADGVELPVQPGIYHNAVLSVTDDFKTPMDAFQDTGFRAALYVDQTGVCESKSVIAAIQGGSYDGSGICGAKIRSENGNFSGILVKDANYTIEQAEITLNGHGGNDFAGKGTAIALGGHANVTVRDTKIRCRGVIRNAIVAGDHAKLLVCRSDIEAIGESEEKAAQVSKEIGGMTSVPWMLGIRGNNRATNLVGSASATYIDSVIRALNWGVLSTDGVDKPQKYGDTSVNLCVKNCKVELLGDSGYGTYSIGACRNEFYGTEITVPDYALICANEYAGGKFAEGTKVSSRRFGVMWHSNQGGETIITDSKFETGETAFLVKGCYPILRVARSGIHPANGVILQLMDNDDPGFGSSEVELDTEKPVKDASHDVEHPCYCDCRIFGMPQTHVCTDMQAIFEDMTIIGNFYNGVTNAHGVGMDLPPMPDEAEMPTQEPDEQPDGDIPHVMPPIMASTTAPVNLVLTFRNTDITGVISATTVQHLQSSLSPDTRELLGEVTNKVSPVVNNGVIVRLEGKTSWTVTGTSYLSSLTIGTGAEVVGEMCVNGIAVPIHPGTYQGNIILTRRAY